MDIDILRAALGWAALLGYAVLLFWFGAIVFAADRIHEMHSRWFTIERPRFDAIHYALMGAYKLALWLLFLLPWLALHIVA